VTYLGAYVSLALFQCLALLVQSRVRFAEIAAGTAATEAARPLRDIVVQPGFAVAVLSATVGYGVMNFLMTATPLAMLAHHHHFNDTATVIEWHIVGMFAPSFVPGAVIRRIGALNVIRLGGLVMIAAVATAATGGEFLHFWTALLLVGVGWNFLFIGGTTLLTEAHRPSERAKAQGFNDAVVFGTMAATSLLSGVLLDGIGWQAMTVWMLPFILAVLLASVWLKARRRAARPA
jgi:MFS family permease